MTRFDLIQYGGAMTEYKPMTKRRWRAYSRKIDHALRYVCPPDMTLWGAIETVFWVALAMAAAACVIGFPIAFVRWWLCA